MIHKLGTHHFIRSIRCGWKGSSWDSARRGYHPNFSRLLAQNRYHCLFSTRGSSSNNNNNNEDNYNNMDDPHAMFKEQMEQLKREREEMFGFTEEEEDSWSNLTSGKEKLSTALMDSVKQARAEADAARTVESPDPPTTADVSTVDTSNFKGSSSSASRTPVSTTTSYAPSHGLTHLSEDGSSVHMVDIGDKTITQRMARAETRVILPPDVVEALQKSQQQQHQQQNNDVGTELIGPKGPIFATAKIAGVMAAK